MITDNEIADTMHKYGGGFASQLALAFKHADSFNKARIKVAFGDLFNQYRELSAEVGQ